MVKASTLLTEMRLSSRIDINLPTKQDNPFQVKHIIVYLATVPCLFRLCVMTAVLMLSQRRLSQKKEDDECVHTWSESTHALLC